MPYARSIRATALGDGSVRPDNQSDTHDRDTSQRAAIALHVVTAATARSMSRPRVMS